MKKWEYYTYPIIDVRVLKDLLPEWGEEGWEVCAIYKDWVVLKREAIDV